MSTSLSMVSAFVGGVVLAGLAVVAMSQETSTIPTECKHAEIQLSILLDCTGSMGKWITAVKDQVTQVATSLPNAEVHFMCYNGKYDWRVNQSVYRNASLIFRQRVVSQLT